MEGENEEYQKEIDLEDHSNPISLEQMEHIIKQMKKSIFKIKCEKGVGTGFLCLIPFPTKLNLLPTLITNNHVLSENDIAINQKIDYLYNDDKDSNSIIIDENRKKYTNKDYDVTIIEIKPNEDKIDINSFLEVDDGIYEDNINQIYKQKSIYILHYPKSGNIKISHGVIKNINENNYNIGHLCVTFGGSSGGPLINLSNYKVIGVHKGGISRNKINVGTVIIGPIKEFHNNFNNLKNEKKVIEKNEIKKEIFDVPIIEVLKAEYTNVANIMAKDLEQFKNKDIYDIIKFTIKLKVENLYEWEVYHKPSEIKDHFKKIHKELTNNFMEITKDKAEIFQNVSTWADDSIKTHIKEIESYYKTLFTDSKIYNTLVFKEFFNIGMGSFNQYNNGSKPFEGYNSYCFFKPKNLLVFSYVKKDFNIKWIVIKDDCIYYMDKSNSKKGKNVFFFNKDVVIKKEEKDKINITNKNGIILLKFNTLFERELWHNEIMKRIESMENILLSNPFHSYTNEKKGNLAHWFSDGEEYFKDLSDKLMKAEESIFITDWWLSPEVWLTRPVKMSPYLVIANHNKKIKESPPYSRLMDILFQCANRGVKIYILIYAENSLLLTLNSSHTQHSLEDLHPNIQVERHPLNCTDLLWSHHEKLVIIDQIIGYVGNLGLCWGRWDTHEHLIFEEENNDEHEYYFPGIDYSNGRIRDFEKVERYLDYKRKEKYELRMPIHCVHSRLIGPVVIDFAKHFVERWNFSRNSEQQKLEVNIANVDFFEKGIKSNVQVLRSASRWSVGIKEKENSILQGYYKLIDNAKHYLYIENQFFVSRAFNEEEKNECEYSLSDIVENLIAFRIRKRIEKAYYNKEKFRVFVFIPLLPGFPGEPDSSGILQLELKHIYAGISRNHGMSIIEKLEKIMGDQWKNYINFYSLRGHGLVDGEPKTELIYINSQLMIVDDVTVILGSANINDRSMLGARDSEYDVIIKEEPELKTIMNGKVYAAANFAYTLRVNLFAEHLGVDPKNKILEDPLSDEFLQLVQNTAHNNTLIYRKLWGCYPDDQYLTFKDLKNYKPPSKEELKENYMKEKNGIIGHAVEFPLHFLEKENNLSLKFHSMENLIPEKNFT